MTSLNPDLARAVDDVFARFSLDGSAPGTAYGVVIDGDLVHAGGFGTHEVGTDRRPDEHTVFRIASMTKSFTAAAVLLLRDRGLIGLHDRVSTHVPEAAALAGPTDDSPAITVRHLLSMQGGLPTDDPWGDRLQDLDAAGFDALLGAGQTMAWTPGTAYEYSNLGYAILGRLITNVTGTPFHAFIDQELLAPLGMLATAWRAEDVATGDLARGYHRVDDDWAEQPVDGLGAFAAMGGLFSSVADLARWVAGYATAWPPREGADGHPLARATRREQQWPATTAGMTVEADFRGTLRTIAGSYCLGLTSTEDLELGRAVGHSGGYPGFGSHMRWHPTSGIGVIGLANGRYAPAWRPTADALATLVAARAAPTRRPRPLAAIEAIAADVDRLIERWDDDLAASRLAHNIALDEPLERRRASIEALRTAHGPLRRVSAIEHPTPLGARWTLAGERGQVRVEIILNAERPPRIQTLTVTSVPVPPPTLDAAAAAIVAAIEGRGASSPAYADAAAAEAATRTIGSAHPFLAPCALVGPVGGDGALTATYAVRGRQIDAELTITIEPATGAIRAVAIEPARDAGRPVPF